MNTTRISLYFGMAVLMLVFAGCSSQTDVEVPESNMRRQMAIQRHLNKLNQQNEKIQKTINEAAVLNMETADSIESIKISEEQELELRNLLSEYKQVNAKTQQALDSFNAALADDTEKNADIERMLDGFAVQCEQQQSQLDDITNKLGEEKEAEWRGDNIHIGIASQLLAGNSNISNQENDSEGDYAFDGTTGTAYVTYVGDYNTSVGLKYMILSGDLTPDEGGENGAYLDYEARMSFFSIAYRIPSVKTFNIVPGVLLGIGESKFRNCDESSCTSDTYYKSTTRAVGFELPFYHQLRSAFSWGLKFSVYRFMSSSTDYIVDGEKEDSLDIDTEITFAGLGLMLGFAW